MEQQETNKPQEHNVRHTYERPFATFEEMVTTWEHCVRKMSELRDTPGVAGRYQVMADSLQASLQELLVAHVKQNVVLNAVDQFNKNTKDDEGPDDSGGPSAA